ncbi:MAG TPA: ABC transporter ATP-binding protein [Spirochaetia bacterium]|nr:ABC transporter ATP-binding protein [Spirochaetales bacterium]HRY80646.1 ABC transporter ATP-binding protein [Spirochaetia bacterium]HRZ88115.1 ABC transporter ATP-binding protein [Spirochaetia bacterium]
MDASEPKVPLVEMRGIRKSFPGVTACDGVDLRLGRGEVLALLGENGAGKSTLMNVLAGLYRPDEGEIRIGGKPVEIRSPRDSAAHGVGMVHQNFMLVDTMTVAENVVLGMAGLPLVPDMAEVKRSVLELAEKYGLRVDPDAYVWQLSVGEQQRVEILKQLYRKAEILVLDEPTAVLTPQESEELNVVVQRMKAEGKSAVFITHKMEEVMTFSDRVMVLRKGKVVVEKVTSETSPRDLAKLMVGREVLFRVEKKSFEPGAVILELKDVRALDDRGLPALRDLSLKVRAGEILGIAGVAGNGQRELSEVITGLRPVSSGGISINCVETTNKTPLEIIRSGVSHIPQDRIAVGAVGDMSVASNLAMKGYRDAPISRGVLLLPRRILDLARRMIESFRIATPSPETRVKFLSGGNIQKTILAREIESCRSLLVAVYPSRGLDIGATEAVRKELVAQRDAGMAVLLVSEDIEELLSVADTVLVLYEGRAMGTFPSAEADPEELGLLMAGVERKETVS